MSSNQQNPQNQSEQSKIKDLSVKIQVLKNALIEERKKTTLLETKNENLKSQLKELESVVSEKEKKLLQLTQESLDIQNALSLQRNIKSNSNTSSVGSLIGNIFQKESQNPLLEIEVKKLQKTNNELSIQNDSLTKELSSLKETLNKIQKENETQIQELLNKIEQKDKIIEMKTKQLSENAEQLEFYTNNLKLFYSAKSKFEVEIKEAEDKIKNLNEELSVKTTEIQNQKEMLDKLKKNYEKEVHENSQLLFKDRKIKQALIDSTIVIHEFFCEKPGKPNCKCIITIGPTEDNEYVMIYQEDKREERYKIENIEYIIILDDISKGQYNTNMRKIEISILVSFINIF
jgi:chromosome segregation ATPase